MRSLVYLLLVLAAGFAIKATLGRGLDARRAAVQRDQAAAKARAENGWSGGPHAARPLTAADIAYNERFRAQQAVRDDSARRMHQEIDRRVAFLNDSINSAWRDTVGSWGVPAAQVDTKHCGVVRGRPVVDWRTKQVIGYTGEVLCDNDRGADGKPVSHEYWRGTELTDAEKKGTAPFPRHP